MPQRRATASLPRLDLAEFQRVGTWAALKTPPPSQQASPRSDPLASPISSSVSNVSVVSSRLSYLRFGHADNRRKKTSLTSSRKYLAYVFIFLLGAIGGLLNYACKRTVAALLDARQSLVASTSDNNGNLIVGGLIWTGYSVVLVCLALLCTNISPSAIGSGLSQMKVVLTGVDPNLYLPEYFSAKTFGAKLSGLVLCNGAGLIVGTEGAWTHLMSILAHHLLHLPWFASTLATKSNMRLQLFSAAAAVAVSSTFASPIGGVLFSIEVTATYYLVDNYMKAIVSAVCAAAVVQTTMALVDDTSQSAFVASFPSTTSADAIKYLPYSIPLGVFTGCVAAGLIAAVRFMATRRHQWRVLTTSSATRFLVTWCDPLAVVVLTCLWSYLPAKHNLEDVAVYRYFSTANESSIDLRRAALDGTIPLTLLPVTTTLAIPSGIGMPTFGAGAAIGRLYGEMIQLTWTSCLPGVFALIGAACLTGAATRTISSAVVALELTQSFTLILPVVGATLVAIATTSALTNDSIYDATVIDSLPYLPRLNVYSDTTANEIKDSSVIYLTKSPTIVSILLAIHRMRGHAVPVVESHSNRLVLGCISVSALVRVVTQFYTLHDLDDAKVDCGLEEPSSSEAANELATATTTMAMAISSIKSAMTSLQKSNSIWRNSIDRIYANGGGMEDEDMLLLLSSSWSTEKKNILSNAMTILPTTSIQALPITVSSGTLLEDIHGLFLMLRIDHCYVTHHGVLVGVVTTNSIIHASQQQQTGEQIDNTIEDDQNEDSHASSMI